MFAAIWAALSGAGLTYAKVGLAFLQLAQEFMAKADKAEIETDAYNSAVDAAAIAMYQRLGRVDVIVAQGVNITPEDKRKVLKDD